MTSFLTPIMMIIAFATIAVLSLAFILRVEAGMNVSRRLAGHDPVGEARKSKATLVKNEKAKSFLTNWIEKTSSLADTKTGSELSVALVAAGFNSPSAPSIFIAVRFGLAIGLPVLLLALQPIIASQMPRNQVNAAALVMTGIGLILPRIILDAIAKNRRQELIDAFPDGLDLMVVCVEAGLGMDAAFARVGQELRLSRPRLSAELGFMADELRAGRSRAEALRNFAARCDVPDITAFTTLMIQSDSLGSSVGRTLRVYASEMRENRALAAEEKATRIPVLLTIPLVACILPVIATALLLPAALMIKEIFPK
jgi:tight adherence protein C